MQPEVTRSRVHGEDVGGVLVVGFLVHLRPVVPEGRELQPRLGLVVRRGHLVRVRVKVRVGVRALFGWGRGTAGAVSGVTPDPRGSPAR